jgi:hypothetical protein
MHSTFRVIIRQLSFDSGTSCIESAFCSRGLRTLHIRNGLLCGTWCQCDRHQSTHVREEPKLAATVSPAFQFAQEEMPPEPPHLCRLCYQIVGASRTDLVWKANLVLDACHQMKRQRQRIHRSQMPLAPTEILAQACLSPQIRLRQHSQLPELAPEPWLAQRVDAKSARGLRLSPRQCMNPIALPHSAATQHGLPPAAAQRYPGPDSPASDHNHHLQTTCLETQQTVLS